MRLPAIQQNLQIGQQRLVVLFLSLVFLSINPQVGLLADETQPRATLKGHGSIVVSLSFSPDGKILASGSRDHSIKLWDVATGRNTATLEEKDPYKWDSVAFSPDGKRLATGGWFNKVKLWDVATLKGTLLLDERSQCPPPLVVFSPDGKTLASGGVCRGRMNLFDVATGKTKATLVTTEAANAEGVQAIAFTLDGNLVSAGRPNEIKVWDVATGKNTTTRSTTDEFWSAAPSSDGKTVATAFEVFTGDRWVPSGIKLWAVASGKEQVMLKGHIRDVTALTFSPDGKTLASGDKDGTIKLWDVSAGKELATFKGHTDAVGSLAFSADGMLASGSADKTIKLWGRTQSESKQR